MNMVITILGWIALAWIVCGLITFIALCVWKGTGREKRDLEEVGLPFCLAIGPFGIWLLLSER